MDGYGADMLFKMAVQACNTNHPIVFTAVAIKMPVDLLKAMLVFTK